MVPPALEPEVPVRPAVTVDVAMAVPTVPLDGPAAVSVGLAWLMVKLPLGPVPVRLPPVPERV
jgi:hypothetical protein